MITGKKTYWILVVISFVALVVTGMRGFYVGVALGTLYLLTVSYPLLNGTMVKKILIVAMVLSMATVAVMILTGIPLSQLAGVWGDTLQNGIMYRMKSAEQLVVAFGDSPLIGKGFGFVLYDFEGYQEGLSKPYLQEIEWINYLAKTGIMGITALIAAFIIVLHWMRSVAMHARTQEQSALLLGLASGMVGLLIASFTNTLISSILFHMYTIGIMGITASIYAESTVVNVYAKGYALACK